MFIWNSIFAMTVIDLVIIGSISYLYVLFYRHRKITSFLRLRASIAKILLGLSIIQLFYCLDLFSMFVLPIFVSMEEAMEFMRHLHLNWRWITSLAGILLICLGLFTMIPKISFNVQRIRNISEALDDKNRELETTLEKLKSTQLQVVQNEKMVALGNLVAGVAHEINNPVGFINGNINAAEEHLQDILSALNLYQQEYPNPSRELAEELEELEIDFISQDFLNLLSSMRSGIDRIAKISKSLRIFSRFDGDEKATFNLHEGIESSLLILKYRLKANEQRPAIQIIKDYGDLPLMQCYPGQLNQVFMNIFANAIDAIDETSDRYSFQELKNNPFHICIKTEQKEDDIFVSIADNARGMKEEIKAKIFEQGFTTKGVGKGTGLGMAIAQKIVTEKHDGAISCFSEFGRGTEFKISLPCR